MRSIAILILTAILAAFMTAGLLSAQEDAEVPAQTPRKLGGFAPSEEVKADTAIPFPTDI